ncbi:MAG TPA: radical SAM protein, partial [Candidatus Bathyarchaeia archaeon]|nr:radical SAM protein [Candidatus Bathyarchaeia archaeon]
MVFHQKYAIFEAQETVFSIDKKRASMYQTMTQRRCRFGMRVLSLLLAVSFLSTTILPPGFAQTIDLSLPLPGTMFNPSMAFTPVLLRGMTIHPENPLRFDFIVDSGNTKFAPDQIKEESNRLVKYFLAAMTVPQDDLWVNLSPYEENRIIPEELGKTELGRDMLAQDYLLKQLSATLMHPEKDLGKKFWKEVRQKVRSRFGNVDIPMDTFNKVWIMPEDAAVYEHEQTVYITNARLKVLLDQDYLAAEKNGKAESEDGIALLQNQIIKEIVLPEIEREVNEGENFILIRQIYNSLILAQWYKETVKESLLSKVYVDQNKIKGVDLDDPTIKDQIYAKYTDAFKTGVFNFIKEDYDELSGQVIPRQYFSGGAIFNIKIRHDQDPQAAVRHAKPVGNSYDLALLAKPVSGDKTDQAMVVESNFVLADASMANSSEINIFVSPEQKRAQFIALDHKLKERGFWKARAADRFNYLQLLADNPSLGLDAVSISDKAKEQLKALSADGRNFSDIARCVLNDVLDSGEPLPEVRALDYIANSPRILLVAPYDKEALVSSSFLAPPLGIYRIANYLRLFGIRCEIFDPNLSGEEPLETLLHETSYDIVGFSTYQPTLTNDIDVARRVKELSPQSILIVGGEGAVFNMGSLFAKGTPFNVLFKGMGEFSLIDLIMAQHQKGREILSDNEELDRIRSIAWRDSNGILRESQLYKRFTNDDYRAVSLYFDTSIVPYERYWEYMKNLFEHGRYYLNGLDMARIQTVRLVTESHCPAGCTFCSATHFLDTAVSSRQPVLSLSADEIVQVLRNIKKYHPETKRIYFNDDNFMINKKRVSRFCELVVQEFSGKAFSFMGLGRIDGVDEDLLKKMKDAGFIQLNYGIEHFSERVLADMHKRVRIDEQIKNLDLTLQAGIIPLINLIPFYPTATIEDIVTTIEITVDFMNKGAIVNCWAFTSALQGATVSTMGYELSEDGKSLLPVDARTRKVALQTMEQVPSIRQRIKAQYGVENLSHTADVLIFFLSFYEAAGIKASKIEDALKRELIKLKKTATGTDERDPRAGAIEKEISSFDDDVFDHLVVLHNKDEFPVLLGQEIAKRVGLRLERVKRKDNRWEIHFIDKTGKSSILTIWVNKEQHRVVYRTDNMESLSSQMKDVLEVLATGNVRLADEGYYERMSLFDIRNNLASARKSENPTAEFDMELNAAKDFL